MKQLDDKFFLVLLIHNLGVQRDSYKASIEIFLNYIIKKWNLKITTNEEEPLYKRTKEICDEITKSD